jgi:hypothetical protein
MDKFLNELETERRGGELREAILKLLARIDALEVEIFELKKWLHSQSS